MLELVHAAVAHVGIAGLTALWLLKTGAIAVGYRLYRRRIGGPRS